nr:hypothetical protein [Tanacetum cinerariifolium]
MRIDPTKNHKEATYQVVLDTLTLSHCYKAFLITTDVPEIYMQQFWFTISKIKDTSSYQLPNQEFAEPPSHEEIITFIKEIGYKGDLESITELFTDHTLKTEKPVLQDVQTCPIPDNQVYGKPILDLMVNDAIKNSKAYPTYHAFSTGAATPKKARNGIKTADVPKKKYSFTANDNIITDDPDVALGLGKSIIKSKVEEQREARQVHENHKCLVTGVIIIDTPSVSKKQHPESSMKLKGIELLSNAAHKGAGIIPEVLDEPKDKSADSSEGAGTSPQHLRLTGSILMRMKKMIRALIFKKMKMKEPSLTMMMLKDVTETNVDKAEEEEYVEKAKEEKKEEELKRDDQAKNEQKVGPVSTTHIDKPDMILSTSSHYVSQHDDDRDQDPPAGPDQGFKKGKTSKDAELCKRPKTIGSSKGTTQSEPKSIGKSAQANETVFKAADTDLLLNQGDDMGITDDPYWQRGTIKGL